MTKTFFIRALTVILCIINSIIYADKIETSNKLYIFNEDGERTHLPNNKTVKSPTKRINLRIHKKENKDFLELFSYIDHSSGKPDTEILENFVLKIKRIKNLLIVEVKNTINSITRKTATPVDKVILSRVDISSIINDNPFIKLIHSNIAELHKIKDKGIYSPQNSGTIMSDDHITVILPDNNLKIIFKNKNKEKSNIIGELYEQGICFDYPCEECNFERYILYKNKAITYSVGSSVSCFELDPTSLNAGSSKSESKSEEKIVKTGTYTFIEKDVVDVVYE